MNGEQEEYFWKVLFVSKRKHDDEKSSIDNKNITVLKL